MRGEWSGRGKSSETGIASIEYLEGTVMSAGLSKSVLGSISSEGQLFRNGGSTLGGFEREFSKLLETEKKRASGQRLEMINKDLIGTIRMLEVTVWAVRRTLAGITLEKEIVNRSGYRFYIDAFEDFSRLALEAEGYAAHAQNITRPRFNMEKSRVRTIAAYRYVYTPFTKDQLEESPEECRSSYSELLASYGMVGANAAYEELSIHEREVLRFAKHLNRPLLPADAFFCLGCGRDFTLKLLKGLVEKELLIPSGKGTLRYRKYILTDRAYRYWL